MLSSRERTLDSLHFEEAHVSFGGTQNRTVNVHTQRVFVEFFIEYALQDPSVSRVVNTNAHKQDKK